MTYISWNEAGRSVSECIFEKCGTQEIPVEAMTQLVTRALQADTHWKLEGTQYITKERLHMILMWDHTIISEPALFAIRNNLKSLFPMTWRFIEHMCL